MNQPYYLLLTLFLFYIPVIQAQTPSDSVSGIAELHYLSDESAHILLPSNVRPLLTPSEQESFLQELEGSAPNWVFLHDQPNEEHGMRLFAFNRNRDKARESQALLRDRIAFLWSGILRRYVPKHQGFAVAMGPELTVTNWGIVRFKPIGIPHEMIAVPSPDLRALLQKQLHHNDKVEIKILFTGHLIPDESIMYAFSHDGSGQGMIMPVVQTEEVQYFFNPPKDRK